jgi:hypothetical protein
MSFFTREQRYEMLCAVKRGHNNPNMPSRALTSDEEAFIVEFATEKFNDIMRDPEVVAVMKRLKDR